MQWNHVFTPTLINVAQFTYTGNVIIEQKDLVPNPVFIKSFLKSGLRLDQSLLFTAGRPISRNSLSADIPPLGVTPLNFNNFNRIFDWKDSLTKIAGNHTIKLGILVMRSRKNQDNPPADLSGQLNYNTARTPTSGQALADALLGDFYQYTEAQQRAAGLVSLLASGAVCAG